MLIIELRLSSKPIMARPRKNPEFITKICEGCKKEFTISYRKKRQRFCTKSCVQNTSSVQEKMKASQLETYRKKYGVDHPMKTEAVIMNFKNAMTRQYGVEHALQKEEFFQKVKTTKKERYGDDNYNNIEKAKRTCIEKYGVYNPLKCKEIKNRVADTNQKKHFEFLIEFCKNKNITPLFNKDEYTGYDFCKKYKFKCNKCSREFITDIYKPNHIFCEGCNPTDKDTIENELFLFINSIVPPNITIKRNDRTVLYGKEIDIYIPFKNIAFELNGLYWHSENNRGVNKQYHYNKYKSCMYHKIRLIHIFENEWNERKDIVKSIIKHSLGIVDRRIFARNCIIKPLNSKETDIFLRYNHLQGEDNSSIRYGLFFEEELVSVMTMGVSRFDKKIQYEMYRYCNKINTSVVGGASKLFSNFIKQHNPDSIISYNDIRYFDGKVYQELGFNFVRNTPPNYWYISKDYKKLYNRINFQKHRLPFLLDKFDPNLTEWENMKNNGFDRIWDCGNGKWVWKQR